MFKTEQTAVEDNEAKVNGSSLKHVRANSHGKLKDRKSQAGLQRTVFIFLFENQLTIQLYGLGKICVIFCR